MYDGEPEIKGAADSRGDWPGTSEGYKMEMRLGLSRLGGGGWWLVDQTVQATRAGMRGP